MWLKCFVLLLVLGALASAQAKSCDGKKPRLKILSGDFRQLKSTPKVKVTVYQQHWSVIKTVQSKTPEWNQVPKIQKGTLVYKLYININRSRRIFLCNVKPKAGKGMCRKTSRGGKSIYIKYNISC